MINYIQGDATIPVKQPAIIAHICNDIGAWGAGFVVPLGDKYPVAKIAYKEMKERTLGLTLFVPVAKDVVVANMIAQHNTSNIYDMPPIRYSAVESCLSDVGLMATKINASIHMPRIGCGLAGGKWSKIEPIIKNVLKKNIVYVYDLPTKEKV